MDKQGQERRTSSRLKDNIPIRIKQEEGDLVTETLNISSSGAYCRTNKALDPMTKLKICFLLPIRKNGKSVTKKILCEGIIVRVDKIPEDSKYNVAIFFNDISKRDKENIEDYMSSHSEEIQEV